MPVNISQLLEKVLILNASDLHLSVGVSPAVRINRILSYLTDFSPMSIEDIEYVLTQILSKDQKDLLDVNREIDFSVALGNKARFRVNAFYQKGYPSIAMRYLPMIVPTIEDLGLPPIFASLAELDNGLVLVTGPTGMGKSTAIAAIIERINQTRADHIITIEDPIEHIFTNKKSLIEQREMYLDTHSWDISLKSVLRQDPDVVVIGEMRDYETISSAITIAETGHLVISTLHTNSAAQTIDRIVDSFPEEKQKQVRVQLSQILEAVISMRLLPSPSKGVVPAVEILIGNSAVRSMIREGKTHQIDNVIATSSNFGMTSLETSLAELVSKGDIEVSDALRVASRPEELRRLLKGVN